MLIERHIFGSYKGYTTLARSPGVSANDAARIETAAYLFGQTYNPSFAGELRSKPAFLTLNLESSRRALICAREGKADDRGRPTLRFDSAIVARRDWDNVLMGDIAPLLQQPQLWSYGDERTLEPLRIEDKPSTAIMSRRQVLRVLQLVSELENAVAAKRRLVVDEQEFSAEDVRAVEMLIPPASRGTVTTAYRCLSAGLPCSLLCLAKEADGAQINFHVTDGIGLSPYAARLQEEGIASGVVPTAMIGKYQGFGCVAGRAVQVAQEPRAKKRINWAIPMIGVAGVVLGVAGGVWLSRSSSPEAKERQESPAATRPGLGR